MTRVMPSVWLVVLLASACTGGTQGVPAPSASTPAATQASSADPLAGGGARFAAFVHHDDAAREFAYDPTDKMQQFDKGWDEAVAKGWTVVSMKTDWKTVFPR
jgi:hypothetical protein